MAVSECYPGNSTVITAGEGIVVSGTGIPGSPFVISRYDAPEGDWQQAVWVDANPNLQLDAFARPTVISTRLTANAGLTLPTWSPAFAGSLTFVIQQGGSGSYEVGWAAAGVRSAAAINLTNTVGATDIVRILWTGTFWVATDIVLNVT